MMCLHGTCNCYKMTDTLFRFSTQKVDVNNGTTKDLDQPSAALIQEVEFKGNGEKKITKECIRNLVGTKLNKVQMKNFF